MVEEPSVELLIARQLGGAGREAEGNLFGNVAFAATRTGRERLGDKGGIPEGGGTVISPFALVLGALHLSFHVLEAHLALPFLAAILPELFTLRKRHSILISSFGAPVLVVGALG